MAAFRYEAFDAAGRRHKGVLEADTARQLRARLREQGLLVAEVAAASEDTMARGSNRWHWRRGLSGAQLSLVTRQFATLLAAGLPVEQTLNALIEQAIPTTSARCWPACAARCWRGIRWRVRCRNFRACFPSCTSPWSRRASSPAASAM